MGESVILSIKDLYKSFGGVAATNGLTLDVLEREAVSYTHLTLPTKA